jgi:hypothetical protein
LFEFSVIGYLNSSFGVFGAWSRSCDGWRGWRVRRSSVRLSRAKEGWRRPRIRWATSPSAAGRSERSRGLLTGGSPPCVRFPLRLAGCWSC